MAGIRKLTEGFDKSQIAGIGCGGQMHGPVVLDKDDRVLRPAILWNDGRTAEETEWLNTVVVKEKLIEHTANICLARNEQTGVGVDLLEKADSRDAETGRGRAFRNSAESGLSPGGNRLFQFGYE